MASLQKYKDHFLLLLEAGFIAVSQADEDSATKLFKASEILNPDSTMPTIGKGYLHLHKLELRQAAHLFEEVLKKEPHNEMAKAFLGISLGLNPKDVEKGEKVLEETIKDAEDPAIKQLAHTTIDVVEKFVRRKPTPQEAKKATKKHKHK
jgi:uncharacterized membrane-anchored protein